jgi:hypothetical protein
MGRKLHRYLNAGHPPLEIKARERHCLYADQWWFGQVSVGAAPSIATIPDRLCSATAVDAAALKSTMR